MNQTQNIIDTFQAFRMNPTPIDQYEQIGKSILSDKISKFVDDNKPIEFVMLGFPFKSVNDRDKVIGKLPDMGEQLAFENFETFNQEIKKSYQPGVKISMASDGYMFNDILGVDEHTVIEYKEISTEMSRNSPVKIFDLHDFYSGESLDGKREKAMKQFGITPEKLESEILLNPDINFLYRGMIRFIEQELAIKNFPSGNQLHKEAKRITRLMMFRNEAYSNLIRKEFSGHIRLSMHPSVNNGNKYSFSLIRGENVWASPWHCAILINERGGIETIHKKDAIKSGYELVFKDGQPFNFKS